MIRVLSTANNCNSPVDSFLITVNPSLRMDSIANQSVCNGSMINTVSISGNLTGASYTWNNDDPSIGLSGSGMGDVSPFIAINHSSQPVTAHITITGVNPYNCPTAERTYSITVHPTPQIEAGDDVTQCRGSHSQLAVSGGATYQWSPATGLSCTNCASPFATSTSNITYTVEGTSAAGCTNRDSVMVNVIQPFDMAVDPNDSTCSGKSIRLNAMNADHYTWSPAANLDNPNSASPLATPVADTRYQVIGYDAYHCFTDTGYVYITVLGVPSVNAGPDVQAATGTNVVLQGTSQSPALTSWTWTPPRNLSCTDCPTPTMTVSGDMSYILTVENKYGCKASDTLNVVTFCKNAQVFIPNAFSPDGDGINDLLMVRGTGIKVRYFRIFNRWGNLIFEREESKDLT